METECKIQKGVCENIYSGLECVAHFVFSRDVWIRTQMAAVASRRAQPSLPYLATHLPILSHPSPCLATHLPLCLFLYLYNIYRSVFIYKYIWRIVRHIHRILVQHYTLGYTNTQWKYKQEHNYINIDYGKSIILCFPCM